MRRSACTPTVRSASSLRTGENTLANFSADGALLFMQHGREYDDIFAHWDWRMVPGTTAYDDGAPLKCDNSVEVQEKPFRACGRLRLRAMCCVRRWRSSATGFTPSSRRSSSGTSSWRWVRTFVQFRCLGCSVITTALDQTHLAGPVVSGDADSSGACRGSITTAGDMCRWTALRSAVSTEVQEGKWDLIDPFYKDKTQRGAGFQVLVRA